MLRAIGRLVDAAGLVPAASVACVVLALASAPVSADEDPGITAVHASLGYCSPGTGTVACQFAYPSDRTVLALLWRPVLPGGWVLAGASGDGIPQTNGTEIVFTGALTNNPVSFAYSVMVPAGQTEPQDVGGVVEYTLDGEVNFSVIPPQPVTLTLERLHALIAETAYGTATPSGATWHAHGATLTNAVTSPDLQGSTQYVCTGWTMAGNEPATGSGASLVMTLTNDAVLTWNWATYYQLTADTQGSGSVSAASTWVGEGSNATLSASPAAGWEFAGWTGDVGAGPTNQPSITLTMDGPRYVTAMFARCSLDSGLQAHYRLDGTLEDSSPYGRHGTPFGGGWAFQPGVTGLSIKCPGTLDARVAVPPWQPGNDSFTVAGWVLAASTNELWAWGRGPLIAYQQDDYSQGFVLTADRATNSSIGRLGFSICGAVNTKTEVAYGTNCFGAWHHLVGVTDRERGELRLYYDGLQVGWTPLAGTGPLYPTKGTLASYEYSATQGSWGRFIAPAFRLDDVRIYSRVLAGDEIRELARLPPVPPLVENVGATNVTATSVLFKGNLLTLGSPTNAQIRICYGTADGGTNVGTWGRNVMVGYRPTGLFSYGVGGLLSNTVYYYRCVASNAAGTSWASSYDLFTTPVPPLLGLSANMISSTVLAGSNAATNTVEIWNAGPGILSYNLSRNVSWLSLVPSAGVSTGEHDRITLVYSVTNLAPGGYTGQITVYGSYAPNSPQTITVYLTVLGGLPSLQVDPVALTTAAVLPTGTVSRTFRVWNGGPGALTYSISNNLPWCTVAPVNGLATGQQDTVTATCSAEGLATGTYSGTLWIHSPDATNSPLAVPIAFSVQQRPSVENQSVTNVTPNSAMLRGTLVSAGWPTGCQVRIYYGTNDGGDVSTSWARSVIVGNRSAGPFTWFVGGLATNASQFYRCWASNTAGVAWAPESIGFTTLPPTTIGVSMAALSRVVPVRQNPGPDRFDIRNAGPGMLNYMLSDNMTWLSVTPVSGISTGEFDAITVSYAATNLAPGAYTGQIVIACSTADNSPQVVAVALTVLSGPPALQVDPTNLTRTVTTAVESTGLTFRVWNAGYGIANYTVSNDAPWFSVSPTDGVSSGEQDLITLTCWPAMLGTGTYSGVVWIDSPDDTNLPCAVGVGLTVKPPPALMLSTSGISRVAVEGSRPGSDVFRVWNGGYGPMAFSLTTDVTWAWANPPCSSSTGDVRYVYVNYGAEVTNLAAGVYTANVMIVSAEAANSPQTLPVVLRLTPRPRLALDTQLLTNSFTVGGAVPTRSFRLWNAGSGSFVYTLTDDALWMSLSPSNGFCFWPTNVITVQFATAGLSAGTHTGTITVAAAGAIDAPQTIAVTLDARGLQPVAAMQPTRFEATAVAGRDAVSVSGRVWNAAMSGPMNYTLTPDVPWLTALPDVGASTGQANAVEVRFDPAGLTPGTYSGVVVVASAEATNTPLRITAVFRVGPPPAIWTSTNALAWSLRQAESATGMVFIRNSGGSELVYTLATDVPWATPFPASGSSTGELDAIRIGANTAGLDAGQHEGALTITAPGATGGVRTISLSCTVWPRPGVAAAPLRTMVSVVQGSNVPAATIEVWNATPPESMAYQLSANVPWLGCVPASGVSTGEYDAVQLVFLTAGMNPGTYTGAVTVTAPAATNVALGLEVVLTVTPQPAVIARLPARIVEHVTVATVEGINRPVEVWNAGMVTGLMAYTVSADVPWLAVNPPAGSSRGQHNLHDVVLTNLAGLAMGVYNGQVAIASDDAANSPQYIDVTLIVDPPPPSLEVNPAAIAVSNEQGRTAAPQTIEARNKSGTNALVCRAVSTVPWLVIEPAEAVSLDGLPAVFTNRFLTATLPAGEYNGAVIISAAGASDSPQTISIHLIVFEQPSVIGWEPGEWAPALAAGVNDVVQRLSVWNAGTGTMVYAVSADVPWVTIEPASGTVTGAVRRTHSVAFRSVGLDEGTHTGCVMIAAAGAVNGPVAIPARLTVVPALAVDPPFVAFTTGPGVNPEARVVQLWNAGTANPVAFTALSHASWLTVATTNGMAAGTVTGETLPLTLVAETAGLVPGVHHAAVDIIPDAWPAARQRLMVRLVIAADGGQFAERIVFDSYRAGSQDIWMIHPDGSGLTTLVARAGNQYEPRPSPDGLKLAYRDATANRLMVLDLVSRTERAYTNLYGYDWLSDSSGLVGQNNTAAAADLWVVPLDGQAAPLFVEGDRQALLGVDWTSDRVYYTTDPGVSMNTEVKVFDPADASRIVVIPRDGAVRVQGNVSRDGSSLCYVKAGSGQPPAVMVASAEAGRERRVVVAAGLSEYMPDFSPDGRWVVYQRSGQLWTVAAAGVSNAPTLLGAGSACNWPAWGVLFLRDPDSPLLDVEPRDVTNTVKVGTEPELRWLEVRNVGNGALTYAVSNAIPWLWVSPSSGTSTGETDRLRCDFRSAGLAPGTYTGDLTVLANASNAPQVVSVSLTVQPPDPRLVCEPRVLSNVVVQGGAADLQYLCIRNDGGGTLAYALDCDAPWVTLDPSTGESTGETDVVTVRYDATGLESGVMTAVVMVTAPGASNAPLAIPVTLDVVTPRFEPPVLAVAPSLLSTTLMEGVTSAQAFEVWNAGATVLVYHVTCAADWLDVTPLGGSSQGEHDRIEVFTRTAGLAAGLHSAAVEVASDVGTQTVTVTVTVLPPPRFRIAVYTNPAAGGWVGLSPAQPTNGYVRGTPVTLTAYDRAGYLFTHWAGNVSTTNRAVDVVMEANKFVVANFLQLTSFKGYVTNTVTGSRVGGAVVEFGANAVATGPDGYYGFTGVNCSAASLRVTRAGYRTREESYAPPCYTSVWKNLGLTPAFVSNVRAAQRTGTKLVDVTYDLDAPVDDVPPVTFDLSTVGGRSWNLKAATLSGDLGSNVVPGVNRRIVWDAGVDWPGVVSTQMAARVSAGGSSGVAPVFRLNTREQGEWVVRAWNDRNRNSRFDPGESLAGVEVYYDGRTLESRVGVTDSNGQLRVFIPLQQGRGLFARKAIATTRSPKPMHGAVSNVLNVVWQDSDLGGTDSNAWDGVWRSYVVSDDDMAQSELGSPVYLKLAHTLTEWNLLVASEVSSLDITTRLKAGFEQASAFLYDVTDGQVKLGMVAVSSGVAQASTLWNSADVVVLAQTEVPPWAMVNGATAPVGGRFRMGIRWKGVPPDEAAWFRAFARQFCAYAFGLFSEDADGRGSTAAWQVYRSANPDKVPMNYGIMDEPQNSSELSSWHKYLPAYPASTDAVRVTQQVYNRSLRISTTFSPCWQWLELMSQRYVSNTFAEIVVPVRGYYLGNDNSTSESRPGPWFVPAPYEVCRVVGNVPPSGGAAGVLLPMGGSSASVGGVTVTVRRDGRAVPRASVLRWPAGGGAAVLSGRTDAAGRLVVYDLAAGDWMQAVAGGRSSGRAVVAADLAGSLALELSVPGMSAQSASGEVGASADPAPSAIPGTVVAYALQSDPRALRVTVQVDGPLAALPDVTAVFEDGSTFQAAMSLIVDGVYAGDIPLGVLSAGTVTIACTPVDGDTRRTVDVFDIGSLSVAEGGTVYSRVGGAAVVTGPDALTADAEVLVIENNLPPILPTGVAHTNAVRGQICVALSDSVVASGTGVTLNVTYDEAALAGLDESSLRLYVWDQAAGAWNEIPASLAPDLNTVSATLGSGGTFALFADSSADVTAPVPIADLVATSGDQPWSVKLTWTAPGDDGTEGRAATYVLKFGPDPVVDWDSAAVYSLPLSPAPAGTLETVTLPMPDPDRLYGFAIAAQDEAGNLGVFTNTSVARSQFADDNHNGVPDQLEAVLNNAGQGTVDLDADSDRDGLTVREEYALGTDPSLWDTDGDGMGDGWERDHGLLPLSSSDGLEDDDHDGLSNRDEYKKGTNPHAADTDGDGIPDGWEQGRGLDAISESGDCGGQADPDRDGFDNTAEYTADSDPLSALSNLHIDGCEEGDGGACVRFTSSASRLYDLSVSTNLMDPGWTPVLVDQPGAGPETTLTDTNAATADAARFYKIRVRVPPTP